MVPAAFLCLLSTFFSGSQGAPSGISPSTSSFSKEFEFLLLKNREMNQNLGTQDAFCFGGVLASRPFELTEQGSTQGPAIRTVLSSYTACLKKFKQFPFLWLFISSILSFLFLCLSLSTCPNQFFLHSLPCPCSTPCDRKRVAGLIQVIGIWLGLASGGLKATKTVNQWPQLLLDRSNGILLTFWLC